MKILQEGFLANALSRLIDLILLNVLWFICSIPIFTIGASTCAVYEVTMKWVLKEEPGIIKTFFAAFKREFKKGTMLWGIFLSAGLFLLLDLWSALHWNISIRFLFIIVILAGLYFYLAVLSHIFPVAVYYEYGVKESIKKAFLLSMSNGVFTVFIMLMDILPLLAILVFPNYFGQILFIWFVVGFAAIAYLNSMHLMRLFDPEKVEAILNEKM